MFVRDKVLIARYRFRDEDLTVEENVLLDLILDCSLPIWYPAYDPKSVNLGTRLCTMQKTAHRSCISLSINYMETLAILVAITAA